MKYNHVIFIVIILILLTGGFSSCRSKEECPCIEKIILPNEDLCNAENPLTELTWLKELISDKKKSFNSIRIYLINYKDGSGFLQEIVLDCCESSGDCDCDGLSHYLRNCEGDVLCFIDGLWGVTSEQLQKLSDYPNFSNLYCSGENLEINFETMRLIYELKCNP